MSAIGLLALLGQGFRAEAAAIQAYDNTGSSTGGAGGDLNIGHEFSVTGSGITVTALGVYDDAGHPLINSHDVTLFSISNFGVPTSVTPLVTATVAAGGSSATDFVYASIAPTYLAPGMYGIIAYHLNSVGGDPYGDGGGLPNGVTTPNVADDGVSGSRFDPFQFYAGNSPNFPNGGDGNVHSSVSFLYDIGNTVATPEPASCLLLGLSAICALVTARRRRA